MTGECMEATQRIDDSFFEEEDGEDKEKEQEGRKEREPLAVLRVFKNKYIPETEIPLYLGENVLGRDSALCSVSLQACSISGRHAVISISMYHPRDCRHKDGETTEALLWDLGSLNGTRIGRFKLSPHVRYALADGDGLVFADLPCQYVGIEGAAEEEEASKGSGSVCRAGGGVENGVQIRGEDNALSSPAPAWNTEPKACDQVPKTPPQPQRTMVPESDSDCEEDWARRRGRRCLDSASSDLSGPTCSTFLTPANKVIPESEDESFITPSSAMVQRLIKSDASSDSKPAPLNMDSDTDAEEEDADMTKGEPEVEAAVFTPQANLVNPAGVSVDSDTDVEEDCPPGMEKCVAVVSKAAVDQAMVSSAVEPLPGDFHMDSDTDAEDEDTPLTANGVVDSKPEPSVTRPPADPLACVHVAGDSDKETEKMTAKVTNLKSDSDTDDEDPFGAQRVKTSQAPKVVVTKATKAHSDSDTDLEDNASKEDNTTPVTTATANCVQAKLAAGPQHTDSALVQTPGERAVGDFRMDSDTDVEEEEEEKEEGGQRSDQVAAQVLQSSTPRGAGPAPPSPSSPDGSSVEINNLAVAETQSFASKASPSDATLDETPVSPGTPGPRPPRRDSSSCLGLSNSSHQQPKERAQALDLPENDWDLQATLSYGERAVGDLRMDSDTDVEEEEEEEKEERGQRSSLVTVQVLQSSTPRGAGLSEEEVETQVFLSPLQTFTRPAPPSPSSSDGSSVEINNLAVAETQSFASKACPSDATLDETPVSPGTPGPRLGDSSFCLGLSDSSHQQPKERAQALGLPENDWDLQATQSYGERAAGDFRMDSDTDVEEEEEEKEERRQRSDQVTAQVLQSSTPRGAGPAPPSPSSPDGSSVEINNLAVAETQSFASKASPIDATLDETPVSPGTPGPRPPRRDSSSCLGLSNSSHQQPKERAQALGLPENDWDLQTTQSYALRNTGGGEASAETRQKQLHLEPTQPYTGLDQGEEPEEEEAETQPLDTHCNLSAADTQRVPRAREEDPVISGEEEKEEEKKGMLDDSHLSTAETLLLIRSPRQEEQTQPLSLLQAPSLEKEEEKGEEAPSSETGATGRPSGGGLVNEEQSQTTEPGANTHVTTTETQPVCVDEEAQEEERQVEPRSSRQRRRGRQVATAQPTQALETDTNAVETVGKDEDVQEEGPRSSRRPRRGRRVEVEPTQPIEPDTMSTVEMKLVNEEEIQLEPAHTPSLRGRSRGRGRGRGAASEREGGRKRGRTLEEHSGEEVDRLRKGQGRRSTRKKSKDEEGGREMEEETDKEAQEEQVKAEREERLEKERDEETERAECERKDQEERERIERERVEDGVKDKHVRERKGEERQRRSREERERKEKEERERLEREKKEREEKLEKERREQEEKVQLEIEIEKKRKEKEEKEKREREEQKHGKEEKGRLGRGRRKRETEQLEDHQRGNKKQDMKTQEQLERQEKAKKKRENESDVEKHLKTVLESKEKAHEKEGHQEKSVGIGEREDAPRITTEQETEQEEAGKKECEDPKRKNQDEEQVKGDVKPRRGRCPKRKSTVPPAGLEDSMPPNSKEGILAKRTRSHSSSSNSVSSEHHASINKEQVRAQGRKTNKLVANDTRPSGKRRATTVSSSGMEDTLDSSAGIRSRSNSRSAERSSSSVAIPSRGRGGKGRKSTKVEQSEQQGPPSAAAGRGRGRGGRHASMDVTKVGATGEAQQVDEESEDMSFTKASVISRASSRGRKRGAVPTTGTPQPAPKNPRRSVAGQTHKILFTGVVDEDGEKAVQRLGGGLAKGVADMTHLVTDKVRRTVKFLCAVARGIPIVTPDWLAMSDEAGSFLSPNEFLVHDQEQEKKFNFCLQEALRVASEQPLLQGYEIHVTPCVKPEPPQMKEIITSCGARYLPKMPSAPKARTVVVSCEEDRVVYEKALSSSVPVVSAEFLLTGILQQRVDLQTHAFSASSAAAPKPASRGRKK